MMTTGDQVFITDITGENINSDVEITSDFNDSDVYVAYGGFYNQNEIGINNYYIKCFKYDSANWSNIGSNVGIIEYNIVIKPVVTVIDDIPYLGSGSLHDLKNRVWEYNILNSTWDELLLNSESEVSGFFSEDFGSQGYGSIHHMINGGSQLGLIASWMGYGLDPRYDRGTLTAAYSFENDEWTGLIYVNDGMLNNYMIDFGSCYSYNIPLVYFESSLYSALIYDIDINESPSPRGYLYKYKSKPVNDWEICGNHFDEFIEQEQRVIHGL